MSLNWNVYNSIKKQAHIHQQPKKLNNNLLRYKIREWTRMYDKHGPNILKQSNENCKWTPDDKLVLINQYLTGKSMTSVVIDAGIDKGLLYSWIRKYEELGYNDLVESKKGRKCKNPDMNKKTSVRSWVEQGYVIQMNVSSILGKHCSTIKNNSFKLLDEGLVHIVSSDTHSPTGGRSPRMEEACKLIEKEYGKENAIKLFYDNAIHVIKNEEAVNLTKVEKSFFKKFFRKG